MNVYRKPNRLTSKPPDLKVEGGIPRSLALRHVRRPFPHPKREPGLKLRFTLERNCVWAQPMNNGSFFCIHCGGESFKSEFADLSHPLVKRCPYCLQIVYFLAVKHESPTLLAREFDTMTQCGHCEKFFSTVCFRRSCNSEAVYCPACSQPGFILLF